MHQLISQILFITLTRVFFKFPCTAHSQTPLSPNIVYWRFPLIKHFINFCGTKRQLSVSIRHCHWRWDRVHWRRHQISRFWKQKWIGDDRLYIPYPWRDQRVKVGSLYAHVFNSLDCKIVTEKGKRMRLYLFYFRSIQFIYMGWKHQRLELSNHLVQFIMHVAMQ